MEAPLFYSYTAPVPAGLDNEPIHPGLYSTEMSEFILRHDDVRQSASPDESLLEFMQSTYEAGARLANWDRAALERTE